MTRLTTFSLAAVIVAAAIPSLAAAQSPSVKVGDSVSEIVRYPDLNLKTEAGARHLMSRLDNASDRVCGGKPTGAGEFGARMEYRACHAAAMRAAVTAVDAPMLTAAMEGRKLQQLAQR